VGISQIHCLGNSRAAIMRSTMPRRRQHTKPTHPLARWRAIHEVTQVQLAKATGLTQGMIAHIENYRHIPVRESLERLLAFTGIPTDAFVRGEQFLREQPDFPYETYPPRTY
jgi:DNA-binding XRE family transcriptional regulator